MAPSFSPPSLIGAGTATLTLYTDISTMAGAYPLIICGTSGNSTRTATVTLVVNASSLPLPQLTSIAPASARGAVTVTITGRDTHFVQGSSQANFGAGITVGAPATPRMACSGRLS